MRRWLLPEGIEDLLPQEAEHVEGLRRRLLDEFDRHGYRLVAPPLLEYVDSLLTGSGRDLDLRTFKLVDQLSGQTMGLRADIAPQVARIDAHLLNEAGVTRLCYCGSVLHARPEGLLSSREPLQIGAELYGHAGCEADSEIIRLLARGLELTRVTASRIDLGHVGIFRALMTDANVGGGQAEEIFAALQTKDAATLEELTRSLPDATRAGLRALPALYGGAEVLEAAARLLPATPAIKAVIETLNRLAHDLAGLPVGFDLADLRGYHYHNGVVFAAYCDGSPRALARGGRYDNAGEVFGRARPATGFSMDLRDIARLAPREAEQRAILAPWPEDAAVHAEVERLRGLGEKVVLALPGHDGHWREAGCNRRLVRRGPEWIIESLKEE